jgi:2-polyprenyl-3-methyl-5-hydroxy-6-metoxy-1,4-benzoquinol methylase
VLDAHRELLLDEIRTNAYREAIRRLVTPDSVVLDLGTGSGILAFFACEAGARRMFAVDATHSADLAAFLARQLGCSDRVEVIHEHSTKIELPEPADVLVTETLGAFGFNEHILSSVIDACGRLLRPGAAIIPQRIDLAVVPVEAPAVFDRHVGFWRREQFGLDLSPLAVFASNAVYVANVDTVAFLATPATVISVDLATMSSADVSGHAQFTAARSGFICGFSGWFRATLAPGIELSNELPGRTHWNHAFLPLESPLSVEPGTPINIDLETSDGSSWRWRGRIGSISFDQMTLLSTPPCYR